MDSILTTVKQQLGIDAEYAHFDNQIMVHINTAMMTLSQIGVGPSNPFIVLSSMDTWEKAFGEIPNIEAVKLYIALKVRILFDPPSSSFVLEAMNRQVAELEWRLHTASDTGTSTGSSDGSSGGTAIDYNTLLNLPTMNGKPLKGDFTEEDPTVKKMTTSRADSILDRVFGGEED